MTGTKISQFPKIFASLPADHTNEFLKFGRSSKSFQPALLTCSTNHLSLLTKNYLTSKIHFDIIYLKITERARSVTGDNSLIYRYFQPSARQNFFQHFFKIQNGQFEWLSGDAIEYQSWNVDTGEPNGDGHCIHMSNIPGFNLLNWNWNDIQCDMKTVDQYRFRPLCKKMI